jgi:hypothetical protein
MHQRASKGVRTETDAEYLDRLRQVHAERFGN